MARLAKDVRSPVGPAQEKQRFCREARLTSAGPTSGLASGNTPVAGPLHTAGIREMPVPATQVSFAIAFYPYTAEQDDEFDAEL